MPSSVCRAMMPRVSRLSRQSGIVAFCLAVPLDWAAIVLAG